jgi:flagellar biosynthetic protein FliP
LTLAATLAALSAAAHAQTAPEPALPAPSTRLPPAVGPAEVPGLPADDETEAVTAPAGPGAMPEVGQVLDVIGKAAAGDGSDDAKDWSTPVKLAVVFAILAILPSLLVMVTSFARIVIVLGFVRRALTTQNIPPTIAIIGLALFLTIFTMAPTFTQINSDAILPYQADQITFEQALGRANLALKDFMYRHTRTSDLALFVEMSGMPAPETAEELPTHVLIPSFAISEFRTAFLMGCLLFIPFLLIDLVVSGILLSAGMMMLPPVIISLPFKIVLFVLVDGWQLLARTLVTSFY